MKCIQKQHPAFMLQRGLGTVLQITMGLCMLGKWGHPNYARRTYSFTNPWWCLTIHCFLPWVLRYLPLRRLSPRYSRWTGCHLKKHINSDTSFQKQYDHSAKSTAHTGFIFLMLKNSTTNEIPPLYRGGSKNLSSRHLNTWMNIKKQVY